MQPETLGKELMDVRQLLSRFSREHLGDFPTPLRHIQIGQQRGFWMKDEGGSHHSYGGNKVRKLEYLFSWAKQNNKHRLVVWGDTASHTVEAVAILGRQCDFAINAVMYRSPSGGKVCKDNLSQIQRQVTVYKTNNILSAYLLARWKGMQAKSAYIPLGATTAYSTLGHVSAACEFVEQWQSTYIRWPKAIYLAMGSGGTVAGLATGFALIGVPVTLNAVQTVNTSITNKHTLHNQIADVLKLLDLDIKLAKAIISSHIHIDRRYLGKGYSDMNDASLDAVKQAETFGLDLEPVHTGKVMAAILHDIVLESDLNILYWHTHNHVSFTPV